MLISLNLVDKFVHLPRKKNLLSIQGRDIMRTRYDLDTFAPLLTRQGFEVEAITQRGEGLESVVVGRIVSTVKHPKAEKLQICQVDVGETQPRQIVCGAKNARENLYVAVALPGAELPNGLKISTSAIREVASSGMLCSRSELGLPTMRVDGDGIWEIEVDAQGGKPSEFLSDRLGEPLFDVLELSDCLLELNVTPNRPDVLCHEGVAREIAVALKYSGIHPQWHGLGWGTHCKFSPQNLASEAQKSSSGELGNVRIVIENELGVPAFFVVMENVKATFSPAWLRNQLEALGQNSINTIVDASNYILLAFGQPSHAFDLGKLSFEADKKEKKISLRSAVQGEKFHGLDGKERVLDAQDCVVADSSGAQALLGVLGGELSKVGLETKSIVLEFANPNPVSVRHSSRRHGRKTDSSFAFEKGIDTAARWEAAVNMIGFISANCAETNPSVVAVLHSKMTKRSKIAVEQIPNAAFEKTIGPLAKKGVCLDLSLSVALNRPDLFLECTEASQFVLSKRQSFLIPLKKTDEKRILGAEIVPFPKQIEILESLGFGVSSIKDDCVEVEVPHWRWLDVQNVACLIEEVIRVVGIDQIPATPLQMSGEYSRDDGHFQFLEKAADACASLGYFEIAGLHFMKEDDLKKLGMESPSHLGEPIAVMNPIILDEPLMQTTLIPDLLRKVSRNLSFGNHRGQLFHASRTFQNTDRSGARVFLDNGEATGIAARLGQAPKELFEYNSYASFAYTHESTQQGRPSETARLAGIVFGNRVEKTWQNSNPIPWDLHTVLSHTREIAHAMGSKIEVIPMSETHPFSSALHPGKSALLIAKREGVAIPVGWVGSLHPRTLRNFEVDTPCFAFELNLASLISSVATNREVEKRVVAARKFPVITRDFAFLFDDTVQAKDIVNYVHQSLSNILIENVVPASLLDVKIFDVYRGTGVPEGKKSIALSVSVDPTHRTLVDADIQKISGAVIQKLTQELHGEMRQ